MIVEQIDKEELEQCMTDNGQGGKGQDQKMEECLEKGKLGNAKLKTLVQIKKNNT